MSYEEAEIKERLHDRITDLEEWLEAFCVWAEDNLALVLPNKERLVIPSGAAWDDLAGILDSARKTLKGGPSHAALP